MKVNKISFKLSTETFGCDKEPTDVVEIYIDGNNLRKNISCGLPLWPSELYTSLMRSFFSEDEPVNIFVCGCGCVGCGDTEVHIDETERFVIWHDFIHDSKPVDFNHIFVFDREQYYSEVNKILEWVGDTRLVHYLGNVFTVWSDELRLRYLADNLNCSCALRYDFKSEVYFGREEVLKVLKLEFAEGTYKQKENQNFFYRIGGFHGRTKAKGYSNKYLELYHHESPTEAVMYVFYNTDSDGKINDILLRRNKGQ